MNAVTEWSDHVPEREGQKSTINEVAFSPDGTRVIAAVGNRVLLYDAESGNLIDSLRGHKDIVLTVDFSFDGSRFASGGVDKVVVIWKSTGQGLLKYNHTSVVQRVRFNPTAMQLASCAEADYGLWSPEVKQVQKDKINSKVLCCAWNVDGSLLALGAQSGVIMIKSNKGEELCTIERNAPIYTVIFAMGMVAAPTASSSSISAGGASGGKTPSSSNTTTVDAELLMIGCWDKTISSYRITNNSNSSPSSSSSSDSNNASNYSAQKTSERNVKFYPTSIAITGGYNNKNSFMLVTGSNKKCILFSRDVMKLTEVSTKSNAWIWSCATPHYGASSNKLVIGSDNGDIDVLNLKFDNVYAINPERYAYRENLTEIVVQHLITDRKVRIKCRDLIQKLAIYHNKLAVQVNDKVYLYESNPEDLQDIHFRLKKERIPHAIASESMAITTTQLLFSNKNVLMLYTFDGIKVRSWNFDSNIRYVKVDGGLEGRENVMVGCQNGVVYKIFVDNPFPLELTKRENGNGIANSNGSVASALSTGGSGGATTGGVAVNPKKDMINTTTSNAIISPQNSNRENTSATTVSTHGGRVTSYTSSSSSTSSNDTSSISNTLATISGIRHATMAAAANATTSANINNGIICLDINLHRTMIATVDQYKCLVVSDLNTQEVLFQYQSVIYVCFNQEVDDMLCFTTDTSMYVISGLNAVHGSSSAGSSSGLKLTEATSNNGFSMNKKSNHTTTLGSDDIIPQEQHIGGQATALIFSGQRLYCLYRGVITSLDIPQGHNIQKAMELKDFDTAYHLACLGATAADWKLLGMCALRSNYLAIAKCCFARLQETKYLNLIDNIENKSSGVSGSSGSSGNDNASSRWAGGASSTGFTGPKSPENRRNASRNFGNNNNALASYNTSSSSSFSTSATALDPVWIAEIMANEGHIMEAAKIYARCNKIHESIRILTEMRRWNDAKLFAQNALSIANKAGGSDSSRNIDVNDLTLQQAKWLQEINDWKGATELYMSLGQYLSACKIIVDSNSSSVVNVTDENSKNTWVGYLLEIMRRIPKEQSEALYYCGDTFIKIGEDDKAKECYTKLNDISKLMFLFARKQQWSEAAKLAEDHPGEFDCTVFMPYAEFLISQDKFMEAITAYKKANRRDLGRKILEELAQNAVLENRFKDSGYLYWSLSREYELISLEIMNNSSNSVGNRSVKGGLKIKSSAAISPTNTALDPQSAQLSMKQCQQYQQEYEHKADLYYAYATIYSYINDPFTMQAPETLFQVCRFIINSLGGSSITNDSNFIPPGISKAYTYYTLGRQAMQLECYKLARYCYERLTKLQLPAMGNMMRIGSGATGIRNNYFSNNSGGSLNQQQQEGVELDMLVIQAKPISDNSDHIPVCYRCGAANALINPCTNKFTKGDVCTSCGHPFVRSFLNFDILPLVEFVPDPSITDEEAIELIRQVPNSTSAANSKNASSKLSAIAFSNENKLNNKSAVSSAADGKGNGRSGKGSKESKSGNANILTLDDDNEEVDEEVDIPEDDLMNTGTGNSTMGGSSTWNSNVSSGGGGRGGAFGGTVVDGNELFHSCLENTLNKQQNGSYIPVTVDVHTLLAMKRTEIYVCKPHPINATAATSGINSNSKQLPLKRATFYKNMLPDISIAISQPCHRFFHCEDYELAYLKEGYCPYSRLKNVGEYGTL